MKYRNRNVWLNVGLPFCPQGKGGPCKGPADILMSKHKGRPPLKFKSHITPDIYTERVRWGVDVWSPRAATRPTNGRRIFFFFFYFLRRLVYIYRGVQGVKKGWGRMSVYERPEPPHPALVVVSRDGLPVPATAAASIRSIRYPPIRVGVNGSNPEEPPCEYQNVYYSPSG